MKFYMSSWRNKHSSGTGLQSLQTNKQKLSFPLLSQTSFYCKTGQEDSYCTLWAWGFIQSLSHFYAMLPQEVKIWKINVARQPFFFLSIYRLLWLNTLRTKRWMCSSKAAGTQCAGQFAISLPLVRVSFNSSDPLSMPWLPKQQTQWKFLFHWSFDTWGAAPPWPNASVESPPNLCSSVGPCMAVSASWRHQASRAGRQPFTVPVRAAGTGADAKGYLMPYGLMWKGLKSGQPTLRCAI